MDKKNDKSRVPANTNVVEKNKGSKSRQTSEPQDQFDINKYRKTWADKVDRRFLSIFTATLVFNVILMLYLSHIPYQMSLDYVKRIQEHYANFIYDKEPEPVGTTEETGAGAGGQETKKEKESSGEEKAGEQGGKGKETTGAGESEPASAREKAMERRAAHTRSTKEIAAEVSNKGLLGLLTGTGSAAQGEAVTDILGDAGNGGSNNLDQVLSEISGIKKSGTPGGSGDGKDGARATRAMGSGSGIDDLVDGLSAGKTESFGNKTDKMVVSNSAVEVEGGKSAGRDPESVMAIVNSHRAAVEYCYQRALRRNPNLKGKVSIRFVISPAGTVKDVKIISSTLGDRSAERCIISKIRSWRDFGPIDPAKGDAVFRQDYVFGY